MGADDVRGAGQKAGEDVHEVDARKFVSLSLFDADGPLSVLHLTLRKGKPAPLQFPQGREKRQHANELAPLSIRVKSGTVEAPISVISGTHIETIMFAAGSGSPALTQPNLSPAPLPPAVVRREIPRAPGLHRGEAEFRYRTE